MRLRIALCFASLLIAGCTDGQPTGNGSTGRMQVLLTDSPFPYDRIARVDMHIVRVQVAATADTSNPQQTWTTVAEPNRTIDLLQLQSGKTTLLGETSVDAGQVGAVRVVINTSLSSITDNAGALVSVHWPVQGELTINAYVESSLALFAPGTPHNLVIDFDVGRSFATIHDDGSLSFMPWIRALDDAGAGAVAGVVRGVGDDSASYQPMPNVAVTVLTGDPAKSPDTWWKIATGKTDAQGRYRVAFVLHGTYIVRAEPLAAPFSGCMDTTNVVISNGETTTLNLDLPYAPGTCARLTGGGGGPDSSGTDTTTTGGPVASVTVTVWPQSPAVGDSSSAFANLLNAGGASLYRRPVTWSVSDTSVLAVIGTYGQSLELRPRAAGTVTLTATSEGVSGSKVVIVH